MKSLDYLIRYFVALFGVDSSRLKQQLESVGMRIRLSEGCIDELARQADASAWQLTLAGFRDAAGRRVPYLEHLRDELAVRAQLVYVWTTTDDEVGADVITQAVVRTARKYALPRPWKLTVPVAVAAATRRPSPIYLKWASPAADDFGSRSAA